MENLTKKEMRKKASFFIWDIVTQYLEGYLTSHDYDEETKFEISRLVNKLLEKAK